MAKFSQNFLLNWFIEFLTWELAQFLYIIFKEMAKFSQNFVF